MCLLARCYTVLIHYYFLESVISHPSFWLHMMIARFLMNLNQIKLFVMDK